MKYLLNQMTMAMQVSQVLAFSDSPELQVINQPLLPITHVPNEHTSVLLQAAATYHDCCGRRYKPCYHSQRLEEHTPQGGQQGKATAYNSRNLITTALCLLVINAPN